MKVNQEIQDGSKELEKVKEVNIKSFRSVNKGVIYNKIVDILLFISEIFLFRMPILVFIKCLSFIPSSFQSRKCFIFCKCTIYTECERVFL